jgi:hypothetical protein
MSHFFTLVIPGDKTVEELLEPYDENIEVEEYDRPCWCVGRLALKAVREQIDLEMGDLDQARYMFNKRHLVPNQDLWEEEVYLPRNRREKELLSARTDVESPDKDCGECHGLGTNRSTYNPKSKWDWWEEGGRWSDFIPADGEATASLFLGEPPFAIVTPDGEWHEKGHMGCWAMVSDEKDDWPDVARSILKQYADQHAVVCDLHI